MDWREEEAQAQAPAAQRPTRRASLRIRARSSRSALQEHTKADHSHAPSSILNAAEHSDSRPQQPAHPISESHNTPRYSLRSKSRSKRRKSRADGLGHNDEIHDPQGESTLLIQPGHRQPQTSQQRSILPTPITKIGAEDILEQPRPYSKESSICSFDRPVEPDHVPSIHHSNDTIMSRPRAGRGGTGRDTRDGDMEADILNRVIDAVKKAKEHNDSCQKLGSQIVELESEIKAKGSSTPEQHKKLDTLYRDMMRHAEQEKRIHDEEDIVSNLAIIASLKTTDEPVIRGGHAPKPRKPRPILESDVISDSPGPSPGDQRLDTLKRGGKGTGQRSSSVASQGRSGSVLKDDVADTNRGIQAEKAGQLIIGAEVFYRFPKGSPDDLGVGIQCIIKKIWQDKKPIVYDVQDPEPDPSGKQNVHRAHAKDLIPIPPAGTSLPTFAIGSTVYARYPDTDTFYRAKVRGFQKGEYTLRFEGEEDDKEQPVEKRFVLDSKMR